VLILFDSYKIKSEINQSKGIKNCILRYKNRKKLKSTSTATAGPITRSIYSKLKIQKLQKQKPSEKKQER